jgi:hypothetical protein
MPFRFPRHLVKQINTSATQPDALRAIWLVIALFFDYGLMIADIDI